MRRALSFALAAGFLVSCLAGESMATTISYSESYNPGANYLMNASATGQQKTHNWTFDITDNPGWLTSGQLFNAGQITLVVQDDGNDSAEKATFTFELGTGLIDKNINSTLWNDLFTVNAGAFTDGLITASLTATTGDFYFRSAELRVDSNVATNPTVPTDPKAPVNPVPEPSTLILLGAGLGGLALLRKKRTA